MTADRPHRRVVVIGGGYAGMAAAITLAQHQVAVTVVDAAPALGGRARRIQWHGHTLDNGQHILLGAYHQLLSLIRMLHPQGDPLYPLPFEWRQHDALVLAPHRAGGGSLLLAILRADGWGWRDKLAFLTQLERIRRVARPPTAQSVATWLGNQPSRVQQLFWQPLVLAVMNTPWETASARVFAHVLREGLLKDAATRTLWVPRCNLSTLFPTPAADWLLARGHTVHTGTLATALHPTAQGVQLDLAGHNAHFDGAICSTSPHRLSSALSPMHFQNELAMVDALSYQPISTVYLQYPSHIRLRWPMMGLSSSPGQWLFDRGQLLGEMGRFAVVVSTTPAHEGAFGDALATRVAQQLTETGLAAFAQPPQWQKTITETRATFRCDAGLQRPTAATQHARVWLAGDYVAGDFPATLESAVQSGISAARALITQLQR